MQKNQLTTQFDIRIMRHATPIKVIQKMATQLRWLEHSTHNAGVTGSIPVVATIILREWRNWQTHQIQVLALQGMRVQVSPPVPFSIRIFIFQFGVSPSGKAPGFDPGIPRFESWYPSQYFNKLRKLKIPSGIKKQ